MEHITTLCGQNVGFCNNGRESTNLLYRVNVLLTVHHSISV
jgi:hypothetical protein